MRGTRDVEFVERVLLAILPHDRLGGSHRRAGEEGELRIAVLEDDGTVVIRVSIFLHRIDLRSSSVRPAGYPGAGRTRSLGARGPSGQISVTDEPLALILDGCDLESYESSCFAAREAELLARRQQFPAPLPDLARVALGPLILYHRARKANPWLSPLLPH